MFTTCERPYKEYPSKNFPRNSRLVNIPSLELAKILELSPSNNILKNEISKILRKKTGDKHGSKQNR